MQKKRRKKKRNEWKIEWFYLHMYEHIVESECEREENRCIIRRLKLDLFCGRILVKFLFIHSCLLAFFRWKVKKTHTQHISHCVVEATRIFHFCRISSHTHSSLGNNKTCEENFFIHTQTTKKSKFYVQFLGNFYISISSMYDLTSKDDEKNS